jgi:protein-ribulosamine 3-kinase
MAMDVEMAGHLARQMGMDEHGLHIDHLTGGDIADAWAISAADGRVFVKTLPVGQAGLLSCEAEGLQAILETGTVRVPRVLARDVHQDTAWLALEYLPLQRRTADADRLLGKTLAALHRNVHDHFGWHRDNFIGRTPQPNRWSDNWSEFFAWQRLGFQLERLDRALPEHDLARWQSPLFKAWLERFGRHRPEPSLIHGDLWQGNAEMTGGVQPVIFDPAVHYADRECDLAMTHLFGGFSSHFYQAYEKEWPLPEGHEVRRLWYQLYHLLNHANLFGGGYVQRSLDLIRRLIAS